MIDPVPNIDRYEMAILFLVLENWEHSNYRLGIMNLINGFLNKMSYSVKNIVCKYFFDNKVLKYIILNYI